jgi:hypothetical protein
MTVTPAQVVDRQLEAYNRHDIEAFVACYTEDARFIELPDRVKFEGHDAFRTVYARLFALHPAIHARIAQRMVVGRFVTDLELLEGLPDDPGPPVIVTYETVGERIRTVWVIKGSS